MNNYVAIIPARGGSKRIPKKNLYLINGKPMIAYAIQNAFSSGVFTEVIVSTDSPEIAKVSLDFGAKVPILRSANLSDDFTTTYDVMADVIRPEWLNELTPSHLCCIYPTTPMLKPQHLKESLEIMEKFNCDYVFPAAKFEKSIYRSFREDLNGSIEMNFPEYLLTRTQDLPVAYHDVGQFYWGKTNAWLTKKPIFSSGSRIYVVRGEEFIDIDTMQDLVAVQELMKTS